MLRESITEIPHVPLFPLHQHNADTSVPLMLGPQCPSSARRNVFDRVAEGKLKGALTAPSPQLRPPRNGSRPTGIPTCHFKCCIWTLTVKRAGTGHTVSHRFAMRVGGIFS